MSEDINQSDYSVATNYSEANTSTKNTRLWLIISLIIAAVITVAVVFFLLSKKTISEVTDYGMNFEGFVKSAKTCEPSKVMYNVHSDLMGLSSDTLYELRLKGIENGTCLFYMEIINYTLNEPQISAPPAELFKGINKTCNIPVEMIDQEFEYWKSGSPRAFSNTSYCSEFEQRVVSSQQQINTQSQQPDNQQCIENWSCSAWSGCGASGLQIRTCTDSNNCGTMLNKPQDSQSCQQQNQVNSATCVDSDNGKNIYAKGLADDRVNGIGSYFEDRCTSEGCSGTSCGVYEGYCENGAVQNWLLSCPGGCSNGACLQAGECKVMVNGICNEYYLPDYKGCNAKSDCTSACPNCTGGTQNCLDLGKQVSNSYDYSNYSHYYTCGECDFFDSVGQCKEGYECRIPGICEPNFETRCKLTTCPNCISGFEKYVGTPTGGSCYDCDTNADCKAGYNCNLAECIPA